MRDDEVESSNVVAVEDIDLQAIAGMQGRHHALAADRDGQHQRSGHQGSDQRDRGRRQIGADAQRRPGIQHVPTVHTATQSTLAEPTRVTDSRLMWRPGRTGGARRSDEETTAPEPQVAADAPIYVESRLGIAKATAAGVIIGVVGTLGVQYGGHLASKIQISKDELGYVTSVAGLNGPMRVSDPAVESRLDRVTGVHWNLLQYADPLKKPVDIPIANLKGLAVNRPLLRNHLTLPDQTTYPIDRIFTNVLLPEEQRPQGQIVMLWFQNAFAARKWLLKGPDPIAGAKATTTLWSGGLVVYYAPGSTDQTQQIKQWLTDVAQCPMTADAC